MSRNDSLFLAQTRFSSTNAFEYTLCVGFFSVLCGSKVVVMCWETMMSNNQQMQNSTQWIFEGQLFVFIVCVMYL